MYQRDSRRREPRRTAWGPNVVHSFPKGQPREVWFHPVDEVTQAAFFSNLKRFDEGSFRETVSQAETGSFFNGGSPVAILSVEDLRKALRVGEELFTGLPEDGPERSCGLCSEKFQPHKRNSFERDNGAVAFIGGDIGIVKKDVLVQYVATLRKEYAEKSKAYEDALAKWQSTQSAGDAPAGGRFLDLSAAGKPTPPVDPTEVINRISTAVEATMAEFVGDGKPPELAVALPLGFKCGCQGRMRDACAVTLVAQESVLAALAYADQRIGTAMDRGKTASMLEVLGARPQRYGAGPSDGRRFNNRRDFRGGGDRDRREQRPHRDWHGADLESATADALDKAGYTSLADALTAANNGELVAKGIAHAGSLGPITFALKRASEGRSVVGEARGSVSARKAQFSAPGAGRPGKSSGSHGKRRRELAAPSAPRGGGKGVGLAELGE